MNEQDIPIDINTNKLLQWLVSRRHVDENWHKEIQTVREKINAAVQDMPEHDGILKLLAGQHINYFHCLKIIEYLGETESGARTIFGGYSSRRLSDWHTIVSAYERKNLYLAEAAQIVVRNVSYELPTMQHEIAKLEQGRADIQKKVKDKQKSATQALHDFKTMCEKLGVTSKDSVSIKRELYALVQKLPEFYDSVAKRVSESLPEIVSLYDKFHAFHGLNDEEPLLPVLKHLSSKGNTTTYEYLHGEKPTSVDKPDLGHLKIDEKDEVAAAQEIDWGNLEDLPDDGGFEVIEHFDVNTTDAFEDTGIVVIQTGQAIGDDALAILDNPLIRANFFNELAQLDAFLSMRDYEMSAPGESALALLQNSPAELHALSLAGVRAARHDVRTIVDEVRTRSDALHNIKHSPKHARNVLSGLEQKLELVERQKRACESLDVRTSELAREERDLRAKYASLVVNVKALQREIEKEISKKYNGRVVHLVGMVNTL